MTWRELIILIPYVARLRRHWLMISHLTYDLLRLILTHTQEQLEPSYLSGVSGSLNPPFGPWQLNVVSVEVCQVECGILPASDKCRGG